MDPRKIFILGDLHGNAHWASARVMLAKRLGCDVIVQLGDMGIWPGESGDNFLQELNAVLMEENIDLWFVDGNHEDFPKLERLRHGQQGVAPLVLHGAKGEGISRIFHIPRGHVWEWSGTRLMGLGGAVSIDRKYRTPGKSWWPEEVLSPADEERAYEAVKDRGVDVLFTHDAATNVPMPSMYPDPQSTWHRQVVTDIAKAARPRLWWHGHMHAALDYIYDYHDANIRVIGLECDGMEYDWGILHLPSLQVKTAKEYYRDKNWLGRAY